MWSYIYEYNNSGTTIIYWNPKVLLLKEKKRVGEEGNFLGETMTSHEKRTSYDGEEIIKSMEHIFEYMTKNIMKGFKFLAIQSLKKKYLF